MCFFSPNDFRFPTAIQYIRNRLIDVFEFAKTEFDDDCLDSEVESDCEFVNHSPDIKLQL